VQALAKTASDYDYNFQILKSVMDVNALQKTKLFYSLKNHFGGDLKGKKIAVWGLAFKPNTDDIREAPALENIEALLAEGASVKAYDPEAMAHVKSIFGDKIEYAESPYGAAMDADALMIMTEWPVFRTPDFDVLNKLLKNKVVFDGRNLFETDQMQELGYTYYSIGREIVK
jgi:UDPglucose 6-dehydrogenase